MNVQWKKLLQFALTVVIGLAFANSGWAVNLVYFTGTATRGLYDFDTDTQQSTLRLVPPGGRLISLAMRPSDSTVFGIDPSSPPYKLVRLDVNTGLTTFIGNLNSNSINLAIEPGTGTLWSVGRAGVVGTRALYIIDPTNATETLVGNLPFSGSGGTALEFLDDGTLLCYFTATGILYRLDRTTAEPTPIGTMAPILTTVFDFAHVGNRLFATAASGSVVTAAYIWEIDVATTQATPLGSPINFGIFGGGLFEKLPLSKLTIAVASVSIKFPSLIGTTYQVQYRSPRTAEIWTDLGERIPGTGNEISVLDSDLGDIHRTYRLQMFP